LIAVTPNCIVPAAFDAGAPAQVARAKALVAMGVAIVKYVKRSAACRALIMGKFRPVCTYLNKP
jgi:hypothetical protein